MVKTQIERRILGLDEDCHLTLTEYRRLVMLLVVIGFGLVFVTTLGILNFSQGYRILAFADFGIAGFLLALTVLLRLTARVDLAGFIGTAVMGAYFIYLFMDASVGLSQIFWLFTYPIFAIFLVGARRGVIVVGSWIGVLLAALLFPNTIPAYNLYSIEVLVRLFGALIVVTSFTLVFEWTRKTTEIRLEESRLHLNELANRDGLTGLYNRRFLDMTVDRTLKQTRRDGKTLGFLMFDLDRFKDYNDTYGHRAGDAVIASFAGILESMVRRETDFAFRYGGEEFCLFLPSTNRHTAIEFAEQILKATRDLAVPHSKSPVGIVTVSAGVTVVDLSPDLTVDCLLDAADAALYEAKARGRNRYVLAAGPVVV